jgi:transcriptional regulator of acetoin/glycerol metabolism
MQTILPPQLTWFEAYEQFAREYWSDLVQACTLNVVKMAHLSGCNRADIYKRLARFAIKLPRRKPRPPWDEAYTRFGHHYWTQLMFACGANVCEMARVSASNRQDVYKKLQRFQVKLPGGTRRGHRGNWGDLSNEEPVRLTA